MINHRAELTWIVPAWRELLAMANGLANLAENREATEAFIRRNLAEAGATAERIGLYLQNFAARIAKDERMAERHRGAWDSKPPIHVRGDGGPYDNY